ncbi:hypothetical protein BGZ47_008725 [Haplosporangium gracile]|nr:hypothetical protein BGZ47_008725 [Haplosporangium gracile]
MIPIPNEVVFAIGQHLSRRSVLHSIMVCRQWSKALQPLLLSFIFKTAWHHPSFPIKYNLIAGNGDSSLALDLRHVKLLEWHNNFSLTSQKVLATTGPQIPTARLGALMTMMPNLTILILRMETHGPDPALFERMCCLQNLKILNINMSAGQVAFPIEGMFPLFSRLTELCLKGSWYQYENEPPRCLLGEEAPWRMKRLTINLRDSSLIRRCPDLEQLRLLPQSASMSGRMRGLWSLLTELLSAPTSLKGLMLYSNSQGKWLSFIVRDPTGGKPGRPHRMLNTVAVNQKKWWSTEDVVAFL